MSRTDETHVEEPKPIHAKATRSNAAYSINVSSTPSDGTMTLWHLRDFLRACDREGIPDTAQLSANHSHSTSAFAGVRVSHTFVMEGPIPMAKDNG